MTPYYHWLWILHQVLEDLYFASGVAIAVAAFKGLGQLKITRDIARKNARREAIKFAAERCQYFAENTVRQVMRMRTSYVQLRLTFLSTNPLWAIVDGEIVNHNFAANVQDAELPRLDGIIDAMNSMEAFAIPFIAGVADDDIGYQECAMSFCLQAKEVMPAIFYTRRHNMARYESTVKLFDLWNKRLVASAMGPVMKSMEAAMRAANEARIRPIEDDE